MASPGSPAGKVDLPRTSVIRQLRPTPRIYLLMLAQIPAGLTLGAKEVARWEILEGIYDTTWALGISAAVTSSAIIVSSLVVGPLTDRYDPRPFVVGGLLVTAIVNSWLGWALLRGEPPLWLVALDLVLTGVTFAVISISFLKVQASFVHPGAEGAGEIVNVLRLGITGVAGAILAGFSPSPAVTLMGVGVGTGISAVAFAAVTRPVPPRPVVRAADGSTTTVLAYLASVPLLRRFVIVDLALSLIIPTQLVNLTLSDLDADDLASLSIAAGLAGVLLGRIALFVAGFRGNLRVLVLVGTLGLAACQLIAAFALIDNWMIQVVWPIPVVVGIGTALGTYAQGLLAAIIQQGVVEQYRGRVSAVLVAGRHVCYSVAALGGAYLAAVFGSQALIAVLSGSLVGLAIITGWYRWLAPATPALPRHPLR